MTDRSVNAAKYAWEKSVMEQKRSTQVPWPEGRSQNNARKKWLAPLSLSAVVLVLLASYHALGRPGSTTSCVASRKKQAHPPEAVRRFIQSARSDEIERVSVQYERWDLECSRRMRECDLTRGAFRGCELVIREAAAQAAAFKLVDAFSEVTLTKSNVPVSKLHFRLAVLFYKGETEVLRLSVSRYPPALSINGQLFEAHPRLVYPLMRLLPSKAQERMILFLLDEWSTPPHKETVGGMRATGQESDVAELSLKTLAKRLCTSLKESAAHATTGSIPTVEEETPRFEDEQRTRPKPLSTEEILALFKEETTKGPVHRLDVYYMNWGAFTHPVGRWELRKNTWTCTTSIRWARPESLARALTSAKLEPLDEHAHDFRLRCIITYLDEKTSIDLSFTRYPLGICINGRLFRPSWEVFVAAAEYLPEEVRDQFMWGLRKDWEAQGYPPIPEDGDEL